MKEEIKRFLKEKKFVVGVPVVIKFKVKYIKDFKEWKATKGTEVMKYSDVLKLLRMIKKGANE